MFPVLPVPVMIAKPPVPLLPVAPPLELLVLPAVLDPPPMLLLELPPSPVSSGRLAGELAELQAAKATIAPAQKREVKRPRTTSLAMGLLSHAPPRSVNATPVRSRIAESVATARALRLCIMQKSTIALLLALLGCRDVAPGSQRPAILGSRPPPESSGPGRAEKPRAWSRVRASHAEGVPLHPAPGSHEVSARLPDGARVVVVLAAPDGRWFRVRAEDGTEGWLVPRYLESEPPAKAVRTSSAWASSSACQSALGPTRPRLAGVARIGTWNVRWFPDGSPGHGPPKSGGTDVGWLACALASLDVDVLAVQEFKSNQRALARLAELLAELGRLGGGRWRAQLDDCPNLDGQHVGLLYNEERVKAHAWHTYATLNPSRVACQHQLRPGFGAYFVFPGGLDLHLISVHHKSGSDRRDLELRESTLGGLAAAEAEAQALVSDQDLLFLGDFNTMGCRHCSPPVSAETELAGLATAARRLPVPLELLATDAPCTEISSEGGGPLDHLLMSRTLAARLRGRQAHVAGVCEGEGCQAQRVRTYAPPVESLSDHCPVVLELDDR
jgi:endonuclease/exonuclease/phosphatase family metal-dependent hydrolase